MNVLKIGKKITRKYPKLIINISIVYNTFFGRNKINLKGKYNKKDIKGSFLSKNKIKVYGNNNIIIIKNGGYLKNCNITIMGNNNVVEIGKEIYLNCLDIYIEDNENFVKIGDKTTISGYTHLACTEGRTISIGEDCMFSSEIIFRTGDSHSILDNTGKRVNLAKDIKISEHVWIGNKTIILKGSNIRKNSIVGTGSVVAKEFDEEGVILAGVPASIIKRNISWKRERI